MRQQRDRQVSRRPRRWAVFRTASRLRRRVARMFPGRIRLGQAGASPRLRRWVLAAVVLCIALVPLPSLVTASGTSAPGCQRGCRPGPVPSMIRWTRALPGAWQVIGGLTGTVPASGLAYVSGGSGVAAVGVGLTVSGYSATTGAPRWDETLTGFPAGAAIVSVRTWPGEVTAGVSFGSAGHVRRTEVVMSGSTGSQTGSYPASPFGGAVGGSPQYTVIVGPTAVTSYDNATGRVRWRRPTGAVPQTWHTGGGTLYVAESSGGFLAPAPVTALRQINLSTGAEVLVGPAGGLSFNGTFSAASEGVLLFSSGAGATAYAGETGARLWVIRGAVPAGSDPEQQRIYLSKDTNLVAVDPLTGHVTATVSGSAANGSGGIYVVRDGVALGLDQDANGDAWGYDIGAQRVALAAAGLPWPHYFVDSSGVGGSADPDGTLVVIAACAQLGPASAVSPAPFATAPSAMGPSATASGTAIPSQAATAPATAAPVSPSASAAAVQNCLRPELVALSL